MTDNVAPKTVSNGVQQCANFAWNSAEWDATDAPATRKKGIGDLQDEYPRIGGSTASDRLGTILAHSRPIASLCRVLS